MRIKYQKKIKVNIQNPKGIVMKKYVAFMIALMAVTAFSLTQAFDGLAVMAMGGQDDCNGSDVSALIDCVKLTAGDVCSDGKYKTVTGNQETFDVIGDKKDVCMGDGCKNVPENNSPRYYSTLCTKVNKPISIDPDEPL
jgi:hypothetical protein